MYPNGYIKKLEIKDLKIAWNRDQKKQQNKAEDNANTFNYIFVLYSDHTSTDVLLPCIL